MIKGLPQRVAKKIYLQAENRAQMSLVSLETCTGLFGDHSCRLFVLSTNLVKLFRVFLLKSDRKFPLLSPHYSLKPSYNTWKCPTTALQPQHTDCSPSQSQQHYYTSPTYTPAAASRKSLLQKGMSTYPPTDRLSVQEDWNSKGRVYNWFGANPASKCELQWN